MKPRRAEGIILYSAAANWFVVELAGGDVRYTCMTSSGTGRRQVRTLRVALSSQSQSGWHDVAVRRLDLSLIHI